MDGKVVMITGASRGIGAAAARAFADAGAKVALLARGEVMVPPSRLASAVQRIWAGLRRRR